jgi:hypothetical protein
MNRQSLVFLHPKGGLEPVPTVPISPTSGCPYGAPARPHRDSESIYWILGKYHYAEWADMRAHFAFNYPVTLTSSLTSPAGSGSRTFRRHVLLPASRLIELPGCPFGLPY